MRNRFPPAGMVDRFIQSGFWSLLVVVATCSTFPFFEPPTANSSPLCRSSGRDGRAGAEACKGAHDADNARAMDEHLFFCRIQGFRVQGFQMIVWMQQQKNSANTGLLREIKRLYCGT